VGFRFRRRIKIFPGITLNLSKSGVSTSVGVPGARMTFGNDKTSTTVGLPGSGISYTQISKDAPAPSAEPGVSILGPMLLIGLAFILLVIWLA